MTDLCNSSRAGENQSCDRIGETVADIIPFKTDSELKVDCVHAADVTLMCFNDVEGYRNDSDVDHDGSGFCDAICCFVVNFCVRKYETYGVCRYC